MALNPSKSISFGLRASLQRLIETHTQDLESTVRTVAARAKKPLFYKLYQKRRIIAYGLIFSMSFFPLLAQASILSVLGFGTDPSQEAAVVPATDLNSQTLSLPEAAATAQNKDGDTGGDTIPVDHSALFADAGPLGTTADVSQGDTSEYETISTYVVHEGDTLPVVAKMFGVSVETIVWANNLSDKNAKLTPGQTLMILPISGVIYTVTKGDTLSSVAKKFSSDTDSIGKFNGVEIDTPLAVGTELVIPDGKIAESQSSNTTSSKKHVSISTSAIATVVTSSTQALFENDVQYCGQSNRPKVARGVTCLIPGFSGPNLPGYFVKPTSGILTQGLHDRNGIDIGAPTGTPIYAAAAGKVRIAKPSGFNGGFGKYVVITHDNGTETVYGHMSVVLVKPGETVAQGQQIGKIGKTGMATGPHLHFEVHNAQNPFAGYLVGSRI